MNIQQFLEHHGIARNPFAEEDAQTDPVFKDYCIVSTYHPTWDKVYGDPADPSTALVFGEKGAGKTAIRLQIVRHLEQYNADHPERRVYVLEYDDFNPFLDRFRERLVGRRRADRVLAQWKLWDHMDAILSLGVTGLVDRLLSGHANLNALNIDRLDRHQSRDLLLLAACFDQSMAEPRVQRWKHLRRLLRFSSWRSVLPLATGILGTLLSLVLLVVLWSSGQTEWLSRWWWLLLVLAGGSFAWWIWRNLVTTRLAWRMRRRQRVLNHSVGTLRQILMNFASRELSGQPLPTKDSTDDRYELLLKFQGVLESMSYPGVVVLVDRVDEPHLINGSADLMKALVWPLLDNKFLKHPGLGIKLMLPSELKVYVDREDRDFFQRARLDKQNMIPSFEWTAESLYDVANARLLACSLDGRNPQLRDLLDESISDLRLRQALGSLRVPRHLFRFLYRLLVDHCHAHTADDPVWKIPAERFEATFAVYRRDQDALDRGVGAG